jgi:hypothetical protein
VHLVRQFWQSGMAINQLWGDMICHRPMTDKWWEHVKYEHEAMSLRDEKYLALKAVVGGREK